MAKEVPPHRPESHASLDERLGDFMSRVAYHALDPRPDVYTRSFNQAFSATLAASPELQSSFRENLEMFQKLRPANMAHWAIKSFQAMEMELDPSFPAGRDTPEAWTPTFDRLIDDDDYKDGFFKNMVLPVASNISERSKLLKAVLALHGLTDRVRVLDEGCSLNNGLKRLALHGRSDLAYDETEVVQPTDNNLSTLAADRFGTSQFNYLMRQPMTLGPSLGTDLFDADNDPAFRSWARSNSFYMGELLNKRLTRQFDTLAAARPEQVDFKRLDAAGDDVRALPQKFDVVHTSTALYLMSEDEAERALDNAEVLADELVVAVDFVEFEADGSRPKKFYDGREDWTYGVWVKNMKQPDLGYQKYFTVESGRAKRVMMEPALARLAIARELGLIPSQPR